MKSKKSQAVAVAEPELAEIVTGCFSMFARLDGLTPYVPVAVSFDLPKRFNGEHLTSLSPTREMAHGKMKWDEWDELYFDILDKHDPEQICEQLTAAGTRQAALLCWCKPGACCHRRYIAEWIEQHCGIVVPELGFERAEIDTYLDWKERQR